MLHHDLKFFKKPFSKEGNYKIRFSNIGTSDFYVSFYAKSESSIKISAKFTKIILKNEFVFDRPKNDLEKALHVLVN